MWEMLALTISRLDCIVDDYINHSDTVVIAAHTEELEAVGAEVEHLINRLTTLPADVTCEAQATSIHHLETIRGKINHALIPSTMAPSTLH